MPRLLVPGCTLYSQLILRISSHIHCIPISGEIFEWNNLYSNSDPTGHSQFSSVTISDQCWPARAALPLALVTSPCAGKVSLLSATPHSADWGGGTSQATTAATSYISNVGSSALLCSALQSPLSSSRLDDRKWNPWLAGWLVCLTAGWCKTWARTEGDH